MIILQDHPWRHRYEKLHEISFYRWRELRLEGIEARGDELQQISPKPAVIGKRGIAAANPPRVLW